MIKYVVNTYKIKSLTGFFNPSLIDILKGTESATYIFYDKDLAQFEYEAIKSDWGFDGTVYYVPIKTLIEEEFDDLGRRLSYKTLDITVFDCNI